MSFLDRYNEEINHLWNDVLKEELIQSFAKFYGKEHQYKIRNVIENLVIIRVEKNLGKENYREISDKYFNQMKEVTKLILDGLEISYVEDENFLSKCEMIAEKDIQWFRSLIKESKIDIDDSIFLLLKKYWYMGQYYKELQNFNFEDRFGVVGRNVEITQYDSLITKNVKDSDKGAICVRVKDYFLMCLCDYGLDLGTLIHEINHFLGREFLAIDYQNNRDIAQFGFSNVVKDFFNEIINDYIALEIFNDLNSKLTYDFDYFIKRNEYSSGYMELDDICSNPIKQVYTWSKGLIADSLIEGKGYIFVNAIGKENYDSMNHLLDGVYNYLKVILEEYPKVEKEQFKLGIETKKMFDLKLNNIYKNIEGYIQYNENLEYQLEEMEKNGTIRRI